MYADHTAIEILAQVLIALTFIGMGIVNATKVKPIVADMRSMNIPLCPAGSWDRFCDPVYRWIYGPARLLRRRWRCYSHHLYDHRDGYVSPLLAGRGSDPAAPAPVVHFSQRGYVGGLILLV
ncbi:MAG: hypothetical protein QGF16_01850 [Rhodospirillales bacterium]|nr:hypothetical protein [Rhodospirillales bacterium]|tara:strand:- start:306 stop:671 length:366 start_codon:yes stop_codon:yes gene_type:complete